ncbi:MAG: sigma-54-dependent Fis family transcriptional regulator [Planctomycetes bacterium]|nr:sigma-54-dependent Fis family transcriptional regulator [Planctomycetota bacterium]NOG53964.1 sigma-54-dependent Fis family transcriptional regulator [Planctomycetota bacterium]
MNVTTDTIRVLVVDDDSLVAQSLETTLSGHGYQTAVASTPEAAFDELRAAERASADSPPRPFHVVLADVSMTSEGDVQLLSKVRADFPDVVVVILTAYGTVESAVKAMKLGAFDYLTHPIIEDELIRVVGKAAERGILLAQNHQLRDQLDAQHGLENILGRDRRMVQVFDLIEAVAPTNTTVLMMGESGTGKSLVARAIHQRSEVRDGPFVEISCGSIPETLLESELFGHVKGAFTGAHADKPGRFVAADGGTIFLDEINSASAGMQLKLLRVLQERKFEPVGSSRTVEVNVRVVLASNQPLEQLVGEGQFRQDLFYRIDVVRIELPPLRERVLDIPLLAEHFLAKYNRELKRHIAGFSEEAMSALQQYAFPGNVRELENAVQRAVVLCRQGVIDTADLPPNVTNEGPDQGMMNQIDGHAAAGTVWHPGRSLQDTMSSLESDIILLALEEHEWNRQRTAAALGIDRTTLYKKMKQYGLNQA